MNLKATFHRLRMQNFIKIESKMRELKWVQNLDSVSSVIQLTVASHPTKRPKIKGRAVLALYHSTSLPYLYNPYWRAYKGKRCVEYMSDHSCAPHSPQHSCSGTTLATSRLSQHRSLAPTVGSQKDWNSTVRWRVQSRQSSIRAGSSLHQQDCSLITTK